MKRYLAIFYGKRETETNVRCSRKRACDWLNRRHMTPVTRKRSLN
jgi:hypothetical protein